ncbi:hypothetical protein Pint_29791 [Pistacia integerrima]|uniref:Uncharacterized protein n=1 Tax=Pistacia integerrima TaxID=434235 RepID=A0ACC0WY93_9ROSI|nr:hypothetical protein Pint_29791 [Pistacia integerrima]
MATENFSSANFLGQGGFGCFHKGVLPNGIVVAIKQLKAGSGQGEHEFRAEMGDQIWNWPTRMKTALGSARGLHEDCHPKIINRDIKSANILIDNNFEAKVADFGLAKYFPDTDTHVKTITSCYLEPILSATSHEHSPKCSYLDPEYAASGKVTDKSDVYSFGVVLVEFITRETAFLWHS